MVQVAVVSRRPALLRRSSPLVREKTSGIQGKMLANLSKESFFSFFEERFVAFKSVIFCGKMVITFRNSAGLTCRSQVTGCSHCFTNTESILNILKSYNLGQKGLRILKTGVILRTTSSISHIISDPPPPYNQC